MIGPSLNADSVRFTPGYQIRLIVGLSLVVVRPGTNTMNNVSTLQAGWPCVLLAAVCLTAGCAERPVDTKPLDETYVPVLNDRTPPGAPPDAGMVWVPGGEFWMGSTHPHMSDARPVHLVTVTGFWMDKTCVTNAQFGRFVAATGYVTVAERAPRLADYSPEQIEAMRQDPAKAEFWADADKTALKPFSIVFTPPYEAVPLEEHYRWWRAVPGASWRHPEGPNSDLQGRDQHPVVHVCYLDALAYCRWADKRLPTEAEWEFAARGGLDRKAYVWGDELKPNGKWQANIWQGRFPIENTKEDGFPGTAPVGSFPANGYGLFDMAGNTWQWCADWYRPDVYTKEPVRNPQGPAESYDPLEPNLPKRAQRGGSFLCSDQYCIRYMPGTRGKGAIDSAQSHASFRCVRSAEAVRR